MSVTDPRALGPRRERVAFLLITRFGFGRICESVGPIYSETQVGGVPIRVGAFLVASGLRGCGQVTLFGLFLSTPHAGEVLEIVEIVGIMSRPSFVS